MGFLGPLPILASKKIPTLDILADKIYICKTLSECGYQMLVAKICNGGRISYIPNISALQSKHFIYKLLHNELSFVITPF